MVQDSCHEAPHPKPSGYCLLVTSPAINKSRETFNLKTRPKPNGFGVSRFYDLEQRRRTEIEEMTDLFFLGFGFYSVEHWFTW